MRTASRKALSLMIVAALFAAVLAIPATAAAATGTTFTIKAVGNGNSSFAKVKLIGELRADGKAVKQVKVKLEKRLSAETAWTVVSSPQTNAKGRVLVNVRPAKDTLYRFSFKGNAKYAPTDTPEIAVYGYSPRTIAFPSSIAASSPAFKLQKGLAVFSFESTSTTFSAKLMDKTGKAVASFESTGEAAVKIAKTGTYTVAVTADAGSPWKLTIVQPRKFSAKKNWTVFSGTGDQVSNVYNFKRKSYRFVWENKSGDPIKVTLLNQAGTPVKTIIDSGKTGGTTHVVKVPKGMYMLAVDAGDAATWKITFKK